MDLEQSYVAPFTPDDAYAAWVSSDTVIPPATAMEIEPVVGGHYRLIMETPDGVSRNEGRFLAVEPGRHVRYTWEWNGDGEVTEIDVTFAPAPEGAAITIRHTGFQSEQSRDMHAAGWDSYITGFIAHVEHD